MIGVSNFPGPERDIFSNAIIDLISRSTMVGLSLLRVRYCYNFTGILCYVYSVYNPYNYGELSIYVFFMLLQDTPAWVYLLLLYFDLQ